MSFGGSVGDIFTVGQFAWNVYKACKGASSEFEEISWEVSTLHTAIKELQDEVENEDSILNRAGGSKKKEVEELVRHCRMVLLQLQRLVTRYKSLGTNQKRTWDRIKFGTEGVQDIREKLTFHTSAIQLFLTTLGTGSLGRIEKKLEMIIEEIRSGRREPSILTTSGDDDAEAEVQWDVLKSELVEDGFTKQDIESHKHWIKAHLQQLIDDGELQERVPATEQQNPNSASSPNGNGTTAQQSNHQLPEVEEDNSESDFGDNTFSSDSEASTISGITATAYDKRATPPLWAWPLKSTNPSSSKLRDPANGSRPGIRPEPYSPRLPPKTSFGRSPREPRMQDDSRHRDNTIPVPPISEKKQRSDMSWVFYKSPSRPHHDIRNQNRSQPADVGPEDGTTTNAYPRSDPIGGRGANGSLEPNAERIFEESFRGGSPAPGVTTVENPLFFSLEDLFTGRNWTAKIKRKTCDQSGNLITEYKILSFEIKPGLKAGSKFKFKGVGDLDGGQHQDLQFIVTEKPHPRLTRDRDDTNCVVELGLEEALTGWSRTVNTIDGKCVPVSSAGPTPPGHQVTFPGLGMPKSKAPDERGDFIVTFTVKFPSSLSNEGKQLISQGFQTSAISEIHR